MTGETLARVGSFLGFALAFASSGSADIGRPNAESGPTPVEVMMFLSDVDAVDRANQSFEANVLFEMRWNDPRLVQVVITSSLAKSDRLFEAREIDIWCRWLFPLAFALITSETLVLRLVL